MQFSHRRDANSFAEVQSTYTFVAQARPPRLVHQCADGDSILSSHRCLSRWGVVRFRSSRGLAPRAGAVRECVPLSAFQRRWRPRSSLTRRRPLARPSEDGEGEVPSTEGLTTQSTTRIGCVYLGARWRAARPVWIRRRAAPLARDVSPAANGQQWRLGVTSPLGGLRRRRK